MDKTLETIRDFVRGKSDWRSLRSLGLQIEYEPGMCVVKGKGKTVFTPTIRDVAIGFAHLLDTPLEMPKWASVLLAASSVIDLSNLDNETGNALIDALWNASNGIPPSAKTVEVIKSLARSEG